MMFYANVICVADQILQWQMPTEQMFEPSYWTTEYIYSDFFWLSADSPYSAAGRWHRFNQ